MDKSSTSMVKQIQEWTGWNARHTAEEFFVSKRTVEGWRLGRKPSTSSMKMITKKFNELSELHISAK